MPSNQREESVHSNIPIQIDRYSIATLPSSEFRPVQFSKQEMMWGKSIDKFSCKARTPYNDASSTYPVEVEITEWTKYSNYLSHLFYRRNTSQAEGDKTYSYRYSWKDEERSGEDGKMERNGFGQIEHKPLFKFQDLIIESDGDKTQGANSNTREMDQIVYQRIQDRKNGNLTDSDAESVVSEAEGQGSSILGSVKSILLDPFSRG
ncbi:hypothetical protein L486_01592 [Kwoniella mangroviensis CBS 10435]|uniref:Uncharacterized protein n=1 Tax=Kwoniella mangroviensis CBS 10435 TaxID=1331196 RepID=A0A1B9J2B2_9TREE|nr:hypothetical protein L486_01592 [Kwoniella mangroviensis CBS 10435]